MLEHRPGGPTRPTILKLPPTRRAIRKRPRTIWLTRKLLWTLGTRRRRREREPHNTARGCHESHQDDNNRNLPLSRIRTRATASVGELVRGHLCDAPRLTPHVTIYSADLGTPEGRRRGRGKAEHRPHSVTVGTIEAPSPGTEWSQRLRSDSAKGAELPVARADLTCG